MHFVPCIFTWLCHGEQIEAETNYQFRSPKYLLSLTNLTMQSPPSARIVRGHCTPDGIGPDLIMCCTVASVNVMYSVLSIFNSP